MPNDIQRFKLDHSGLLVPDHNGFTRDQIHAGLTTPACILPSPDDIAIYGNAREAERALRRLRRVTDRSHASR